MNKTQHEMYVSKRNGTHEPVSFDKILRRIKSLAVLDNEELNINFTTLTMKIIDQLYDNIHTREIDELTAQQCASLSTKHVHYGVLASRILISNHHKNTEENYFKIVEQLYNFKDVNNKHHPLISKELYCVVEKNAGLIQSKFDFNRDYKFDYFGFKTLEKAYLMRVNDVIIERPQHMWMRVALGIHGNDLDAAFETYELMSQKYFTHATPTLFNSGTPRPQMSSCYLLAMEDDSIKGIYNTLSDCAAISKWAGGIGLHIHNVRSKGSQIRGTNGVTDGLVPMLRVFNSTARYVNQSGKRNGSFAMYLEPWHADIFDFLELKKNHGDEELKARDLFYALWIPDLFMKRVKEDGKWSLMCPDKCPGLSDSYGHEFEELYTKYENENRGNKTINARDLWIKILDSQIETGTPYMLYKDASNKKSNQQNLGTIKSSNLCVAPETKIMTSVGEVTISDYENKVVEVWNGYEFSETKIRKTGIDQELITICFSDGNSIDCTPYHKFHILVNGKEQILEAQELQINDVIVTFYTPFGLCKKDIYITDVINNGRFDDTYCFNEPKNHTGVFNGIMTGQCTEIIEYSDDKETAVCNLASIGLSMFVDPPKTDYINEVKLYTKADCIYCNVAKTFLQQYNLNFSYEELNDDEERRAKYDELNAIIQPDTPINSVPQIFINGNYVGGASELIQILRPTFNYDKLHQVTKVVTNNLNKVIDVNFYPTEKTRRSNMKHRPIGIGVQGLADVFAKMYIAFNSQEASDINEKIFETIYHASCEKSMEIAKSRQDEMLDIRLSYRNSKFSFDSFEPDCNTYSITQETPEHIKKLLHKHMPTYGELFSLSDNHVGAYSSFDGSPASKGLLQFDLWNETPSNRYDWDSLKQNIMKYGMRNSLLVAPMPTASTSQILGNNECFEPFTSNIYLRRTLAGEFIVINKYLIADLINLGLWNDDIKNSIILHKGSIQQLTQLPKYIRETYKIVWEIPMRNLINMAASRGKYICQSQSMNLWMENPTYDKITAMHFYAWQKGLKTGIYYLRTKAKASAQQFTIDPSQINKYKNLSISSKANQNNNDDDEGCLMCSG